MTLVERIKEKSNISLAQLEKQLGFGNGTIARWDTNSPSVDKIVLVANFLNVSTDYLLTGKEYNLTTPSRCLHKLLKTNNVTIEQLKSEAHITQSTINMLELDQLDGIEPMQLWAVCNYFHLTVNIFEKMLFEQNNTLIGLTPKLSKEETEKVVAYIQGMIANRK